VRLCPRLLLGWNRLQLTSYDVHLTHLLYTT
jgi:hypothetical protein